MPGKIAGFALVFFTLSIILSACFVEFDPNATNDGSTYGTYTGDVTGSANGFNGKVTVTLSLVNGKITAAVITGPLESAEYGQKAIKAAPKVIVAKNSVEIDTLSEASYTSKAIKLAGEAALATIPNPTNP